MVFLIFWFSKIWSWRGQLQKGKDIIDGKLKEKEKNLKQMYINAYQSYLFNSWLSKE